MKRMLPALAVFLLLAFAATPAFAQGRQRGDHLCFGGNTVVQGYSPDSVVLFGCGARIAGDTRVNRNVVSFGGDVVVEKGAIVGGDIVVFGGNLDLAGEVDHRVTLFGGTVTLESGSVVQNNVQVFGGRAVKKDGAVVRGSLFRAGGPALGPAGPFFFPAGLESGGLGFVASSIFGFFRSLVTALALAALGALTVVFLPTHTRRVGLVVENTPLPSVGVGCLTLVCILVLVPLLTLIIIGIPAALVLVFAFVVAGLFGWIAIGRLVGERLLVAFNVREILPVVAVVVGVLLIAILGSVPILGGLLNLVIGLLGLGAVVLTRFGTRTYPPNPSTALVPIIPAQPTEQKG